MKELYVVCKAVIDPVLIIFVLLLVALAFFFAGRRKNNNIPILFPGLAILLLYGASIAHVADYLAYSLEKDYFSTSKGL